MSSFKPMLCDLNDFACVRKFCEDVTNFANEKPLDRLVCNAAVYQPSLDVPKWSKDGIEQQMQSNFLSHFLMISLLMPFMKGASGTYLLNQCLPFRAHASAHLLSSHPDAFRNLVHILPLSLVLGDCYLALRSSRFVSRPSFPLFGFQYFLCVIYVFMRRYVSARVCARVVQYFPKRFALYSLSLFSFLPLRPSYRLVSGRPLPNSSLRR